jgi:uncharacterized protein
MGRSSSSSALLLALALFPPAWAQPRQVLFVTHSAGFRHDSIPTAAEALAGLARADGRFAVTHTEDLAYINPDRLAIFHAVFFFTSGELPINQTQKNALLNFVDSGGGFGGVHSATDTLYNWPEYGALIGAYFNVHPWTQNARVDIEDPAHPTTTHLGLNFPITEEFYQFRAIDRTTLRVLMTLDTRSVDLNAPGTNPNTRDFPLAWARSHGRGRVYYNALGHFQSTWRDPRFTASIHQALLWLTGLTAAESAPQPARRPDFSPQSLGNAATLSPRGRIAPGSIFSIFGAHLTNGASTATAYPQPTLKAAGTEVFLNAHPVHLLYVSPTQINAQAPPAPLGETASLEVRTPAATHTITIPGAVSALGLFAVTQSPGAVTLWVTGLNGKTPQVRLAAQPAQILYAGPAPGWPGLDQINVALPPNLPEPAQGEVELDGEVNRFFIRSNP